MSDPLYRICRVSNGTKSVVADGLSKDDATTRMNDANRERNQIRAYLLWEQDSNSGAAMQSPETYWERAEVANKAENCYIEATAASSTTAQPMRVAAKQQA